jgi:hypothetical protein
MDFLMIDRDCNTIKGPATSHIMNVEVYFILVIMGIEYAINLGGQEITDTKNGCRSMNIYRQSIEAMKIK